MRLQTQVFLALLLASSLAITLLFFFNTWSFSARFGRYVNKQHLAPVIAALVDSHRQRGDFEWLRSNPESEGRGPWEQFLREHLKRPPKPVGLPRDKPKRPPNKPKGKPPHSQVYALADVEKTRIAGKAPEERLKWIPVRDDGNLIAYVGYAANEQADDVVHRAFEKQQRRSYAWATLGLLVFSALMSFAAAAWLVKPIMRVNKAVNRLRSGSFDVRLPARRQDEIGELSRHINVLAETLARHQTSRRRWIAEMSHELRTPLAVLQGELEAIEDGIRPFSGEGLESLQQQTHRLARLVNDLHTLSLSDVGALEYRFTPLRVDVIAQRFLRNSQAAISNAGLNLVEDWQPDLPKLEVDEQRFEQLLSNLLQNTLRYTNEGGVLSVSAHRHRNEDGHAQLQLVWSDSDPAVPESQLSQLFDPLFRVEASRERKSGGSGLGLAIARRIVEAHEGRITAHTSSLGGLEIRIGLPIPLSGAASDAGTTPPYR